MPLMKLSCKRLMPELAPGRVRLAIIVLPELILASLHIDDFKTIERGDHLAIASLLTKANDHAKGVTSRGVIPCNLLHRQGVAERLRINAPLQYRCTATRSAVSDMIGAILKCVDIGGRGEPVMYILAERV